MRSNGCLDLRPARWHEVLEWMRSKVASPPVVVVLTNSILPHDLTRSLDLGAAAYHVKTAERSEQPELIRALEKLLDDRVGRLKSTPA